MQHEIIQSEEKKSLPEASIKPWKLTDEASPPDLKNVKEIPFFVGEAQYAIKKGLMHMYFPIGGDWDPEYRFRNDHSQNRYQRLMMTPRENVLFVCYADRKIIERFLARIANRMIELYKYIQFTELYQDHTAHSTWDKARAFLGISISRTISWPVWVSYDDSIYNTPEFPGSYFDSPSHIRQKYKSSFEGKEGRRPPLCPNANKLLPMLIMSLLNFQYLTSIMEQSRYHGIGKFLRLVIRLLFERAEELIAKNHALGRQQNQDAQTIHDHQLTIMTLEAKLTAQQPIVLLEQKLTMEKKQCEEEIQCLARIAVIAEDSKLDDQRKVTEIDALLKFPKVGNDASIPASMPSQRSIVTPDQKASPIVPAISLQIMRAALQLEVDEIKQMIFMRAALGTIYGHAKIINDITQDTWILSSSGRENRQFIGRQFQEFFTTMIVRTPAETPKENEMILKANQCLRQMIYTLMETIGLCDERMSYFSIIKHFIRDVTVMLFERIEFLCIEANQLEEIQDKDAKKIAALNSTIIALRSDLAARDKAAADAIKRCGELQGQIAIEQRKSVRPKRCLKEISAIFTVREPSQSTQALAVVQKIIAKYK